MTLGEKQPGSVINHFLQLLDAVVVNPLTMHEAAQGTGRAMRILGNRTL